MKEEREVFCIHKHRQRCGGEGSVMTREVKRVSSLEDELFASANGLCKGAWMETGPKMERPEEDKRMNGQQRASKISSVRWREGEFTSPHHIAATWLNMQSL